ncbi:MAG TPA: extensin family protein [Aestuariivirga sp.]|nr:extensin family protein [Aestuariivirga sp.]
MGKLKYILILAAILAMPGWESADAAQPKGLKNFLNNLDRRVCQKFNATCKTRSRAATKRKKQTPPPVAPEEIETSAATPITEPPIPIEKPKMAQDVTEPAPLPFEKPKTAQDVAEPAPIPRAKPEELQKHAAIEPAALPAATKSNKVDKLATSPPKSTQRPVIASKAMVSTPQPRIKPQGLQQQAALIPRALPKDIIRKDDSEACFQMLRAIGAKFKIAAATVDYGKCHVENPVNLLSVTIKENTIKFPEAPLFNCKFALQFSKWLSESGAPILAAQMNSPVESISTGPGFECRGRNGDGTAKVSEHGYGNAVDLTTFRLRNGKTLNVGDSTLLPGVRASGCGYFTTVLGPGSNAAHASHLHFDMGAHGKSGNYRICQ